MERRTAMVTGGNRGIGLETATQLAARGWRVLIACRDGSAGGEAAAAIGDDAEVVVVDLERPASIRSALAALEERGEAVDVLVNNAGILPAGSALDTPLAELARALQVNTLGPTALLQGLAPGMIQRGFGRIVNVSSGWGSFAEGLEGPLAYAVAKAALNAVTVKFAQELPDTVKVNACCPGWVRTRMGGPDADRSLAEGAQTVVWLATLDEQGPTGGFFRDRQPIAW